MNLEFEILTRTSKRQIELAELVVVLFEQCNLSCFFCTQDHDSIVGMDKISEKYDLILEAFDNQRNLGEPKQFNINFMGGELFEDRISDEVFKEYDKLVTKLKSWNNTIDCNVNIRFITNLVYNKTDRVKKFLDKHDIKIAVSYDSASRFNINNKELFKRNIEIFRENIDQIACTIVKPSMKAIMEKKDSYFDYLCDNFEVYFDYYTLTTDGGLEKQEFDRDIVLERHRRMAASDVQLRDFFKFMVKNYPMVFPFEDLLKDEKVSMTCHDTAHILADGSITRCVFAYHGEKDYQVVKAELETEWLQTYKCFECEYLNRCPLGCFVAHQNVGFRTQEECWLKETFDYIIEEDLKPYVCDRDG